MLSQYPCMYLRFLRLICQATNTISHAEKRSELLVSRLFLPHALLLGRKNRELFTLLSLQVSLTFLVVLKLAPPQVGYKEKASQLEILKSGDARRQDDLGSPGHLPQ